MSKNNNIYLVASYSARPKDPRMTSQKGYMSNSDNIEYDEQVYVARGMSQKHLKNQVVLDLTEEKIVKNSFRSEAEFESLFAHFVEGYGNYINNCVNQLNEELQIK